MSFRVSGEPNGRSRSLSAESPLDQLPGKETRIGKWKNIPVPSGDLTIPGKDIVETFRAYVNLKNLGDEFKIKINGIVRKPDGISSRKDNLRPLFKWLILELGSEDGKQDSMELEKHLDTLFTPCEEPEGLDFVDSKEFRRSVKQSKLRLRRITSLDTDPKVTALISPEELSSVLSQSHALLEDKKVAVRRIVMKKTTENHLQDVPHIKILSALSINAFSQADNKIKELFAQFSPLNKATFQLKYNPNLGGKFSIVQNEDGSFKATQTRTYLLREDAKDGSVTPLRDLGVIRARWSVASHAPDTFTGNLTLSKIKFLEDVDELKKNTVAGLFQEVLDDKSNTIQKLTKAISNLPSKRETIDLGTFATLTGSKLLEPIYTYLRATFTLPKVNDRHDFDEIKFSARETTSFVNWFLGKILQSKDPAVEHRLIYENHLSSRFKKEERHYGEQFLTTEFNEKLFVKLTKYPLTNFDEGYFLALKRIASDRANCRQLIEAIKKCRDKEEAGKAVTQAVLTIYSTPSYNLASDIRKFQVMAFAASSDFDKPLKREFASFQINSPQFRIERDGDRETEMEVLFLPKTGEFEIEQKRFYKVKQGNSDSDVLEFTVVSAITDNNGKCTGSHKVTDLNVCDGVYPPIAAGALQGLKQALET